MNTFSNLQLFTVNLNKLLSSRIIRLIFVLKSLTKHKIDFVYYKKASKLGFCSRLKKYVLRVSIPVLVFIIIETVFFGSYKSFLQTKTFPWSRKFSTFKKIFLDQGSFPQSRKFSTVKEVFHSQKFFPQLSRFFVNKEVFRKKILFSSWRTSSVVRKKFNKQSFCHSQKNVSANKDQKGSIF